MAVERECDAYASCGSSSAHMFPPQPCSWLQTIKCPRASRRSCSTRFDRAPNCGQCAERNVRQIAKFAPRENGKKELIHEACDRSCITRHERGTSRSPRPDPGAHVTRAEPQQ